MYQKLMRIAFMIRKIILSIVLLGLSVFIRRKENYVALGSWRGELYLDNSKYLAEYLRDNRKDIKIFWVGNKEIEDVVVRNLRDVVFIQKDHFLDCIKLLRCKYMFFSQMHTADISVFNVYRGAVLCYLHHGFPIKKWGQDGLNERETDIKGIRRIMLKLCGNQVMYDYFVTSSQLQDITNCTALAYLGCTKEKNIHSGTPRNDIYFHVDRERMDRLKNEYAKLIGFDKSSKVIVYLPTYRRTSTAVFTFTMLDNEKKSVIDRLLRRYNCVIIEKSHFAAAKKCDITKKDDRIIGCTQDINVQELMMLSDVLISDYSGAIMDFLFLDRPIIHYAYDYDYYRNVDSGLYYEIEDFSAGPIAQTFEELVQCLRSCIEGEDSYSEKRMYVRNKYMSYECGKASETITKVVIDGGT